MNNLIKQKFKIHRRNTVSILGVLMISVLLITGMVGCQAEQQKEAFSESDFLNEIKPNLECLNSCVQVMFMADVDFNVEYISAYDNEEAYDDGLGERAVLFLPEEEEAYAENYYIDPTYASLYTVNNFKTNEEVRENLRKYMTDEIIDKYFDNDFFEYEGNLYLVRGARGYGAVTVDMDSVKYIEEKDGKQYVSVDFLLFDELYYTETIEFSQSNGNWIITGETETDN